MWRWFTYEEEYLGEESKHDPNHVHQTSSSGGRLSARAPDGGSSGYGSTDSDSDVAPTFDQLDPSVTAAILAQVRDATHAWKRQLYCTSFPESRPDKSVQLRRNHGGINAVHT